MLLSFGLYREGPDGTSRIKRMPPNYGKIIQGSRHGLSALHVDSRQIVEPDLFIFCQFVPEVGQCINAVAGFLRTSVYGASIVLYERPQFAIDGSGNALKAFRSLIWPHGFKEIVCFHVVFPYRAELHVTAHHKDGQELTINPDGSL